VKVGFQELEYTSMEGENTLVCVDINRKLEKPVSVKYTLGNSSALDFGKTTIFMQHRMPMALRCPHSDNNEPGDCGTLVIGENASPAEPFTNESFCFNVSVSEDLYKEAVEVFTLTLTTDDPCVWLGRDGTLLAVEENGGMYKHTLNHVLYKVIIISPEVTVGFDVDDHVEVYESDGFVKICVEADRKSQSTYEIMFETMGITATRN
jgi:hypothetical protein